MPDKEVDDIISDIRRRQAQFIDAGERAIKEDDFVVMDYRCLIDGDVKEDRKNYGFELTSPQVFPQFKTGLVGLNKESTKTLEIDFPKDFARDEWAGKKGVFEIIVKEIKEAKLPELNDDFVKQVSEHDSLDVFRKSIRENGLKHKEIKRRDEEAGQVIDQLLAVHRFDVPASVEKQQQE